MLTSRGKALKIKNGEDATISRIDPSFERLSDVSIVDVFHVSHDDTTAD